MMKSIREENKMVEKNKKESELTFEIQATLKEDSKNKDNYLLTLDFRKVRIL